MTNDEIIETLKEELIILINCTDDVNLKAKLRNILHGEQVLRCKCPKCGEKFEPKDNLKLSVKIL